MASIKLGTIVVGIRGTVGGLLLSSNLGGPYARIWSKGSNPRKPLQTSARTVFGGQATAWAGIDGAVRADWGVWAAAPAQARTNSLGLSYNMSGFNALVSNTRNMISVGRTPSTAAPTLTKPTAPAGLTCTIEGHPTTCTLSWSVNPFGASYDCIIECSLATGPGATVARGPWKQVYTAQSPSSSPVDFSGGFAARFGSAWPGQRVFVRVYRQNLEGYRSEATALTVDVGI